MHAWTFPNNLDNDGYWRGFRRGDWCHSIAVRDFIVRNVSPCEGDETFLAGPSKPTKAVCGATIWMRRAAIKVRMGESPSLIMIAAGAVMRKRLFVFRLTRSVTPTLF